MSNAQGHAHLTGEQGFKISPYLDSWRCTGEEINHERNESKSEVEESEGERINPKDGFECGASKEASSDTTSMEVATHPGRASPHQACFLASRDHIPPIRRRTVSRYWH